MRFDPIRRIPTFAATLVSLAAILAACAQVAPGPDPDALFHVRFSSGQEVSAVQADIAYDPTQVAFVGVRLFDDAVLCRAFDDESGTVTVGLIALDETAPLLGDVLTLYFELLDPDTVPTATIVASPAYTFDEAPVLLTSDGATSGDSLPQPDACMDAGSDVATHSILGTASTPLDLELQPSFADYRLGDATRDDTLDVLDVLRVLKIATEAISSPTDFEFYHSDLNGDASVDTLDVLRVLDKAVDPTLPAELHVAPRPVSFAHVRRNGPILVNNAGNQSLSGTNVSATGGVSISQLGGYGVTGQSAAYSVDVSGTWSNEGATFSSGAGGAIDVAIGNIAILIAGQSNAAGYGEPLNPTEPGIPQVRMFGNDYVWKQAYEPLDDESGQVDTVSAEGSQYDPDHSFGVRLGKELHSATQGSFDGVGRYVYLIPSARQGSYVNTNLSPSWRPSSDRLSRSTLFGSANYRAQASAGTVAGSPYQAEGGPVSAIVWYQGESDAGDSYRPDFISNTNIVMDAFRSELDNVPILYVQLATHTAVDTNNRFQSLRERQRLMESGVPSVDTGLGSAQPRTDYHLVVAHDLPMTDSVHLSKEGQLMLAERIALAYREHVMGEPVDGTGPRLQGIVRSGNVISVDTTRTINDDADYGGYFRVFLASDTSVEYAISQIRRDPNDATAIEITLVSTPSGSVRVVYKPPPNRPLGTQVQDVVKDAATGLPLPAFGSLID